MAGKTVKIKLTAAVAFDGKIAKKGIVKEVPEDVAKDLLHRGRAELVGKKDDAEGGKDPKE